MSKNEVLEQIYPDEVPDILKKVNLERAQQREKELTGYFYTLMAPVLPWLKDDSTARELMESITSELKQIHEYLRGKGKGTTSEQINQQEQESQEDPFERLKKLQNVIAGTQARKKAQKAR